MATQQKQSKTSKAPTGVKKTTPPPTSIETSAEEEKRHLIEEAAYFIAERRGFQGDLVLDDWLQAEREVNSRSAQRH
jgi:hypothetical protein